MAERSRDVSNYGAGEMAGGVGGDVVREREKRELAERESDRVTQRERRRQTERGKGRERRERQRADDERKKKRGTSEKKRVTKNCILENVHDDA